MSARLTAGERGRMLASSSYAAASRGGSTFGGYFPAARSVDSAIIGDRDLIDRRMRDMTRNSGWVAGGVRKKIDKFIGARIRPQFKPNWRMLGIDIETAKDVGRQMEAAFWMAAHSPGKSVDAARRLNFGAIARVLFWHWISDGRALVVPLWLPRYGSAFSTSFMTVDPFRLSNPDGKQDSIRLRGGVEMGAYGEAQAYHIRESHPHEILADAAMKRHRWERIPAYTRWGRPKVIYGFDQRQAEQSQGISDLVMGLKKIKMLEHLDDYELGSAALSAFYGMQVKSDLSSAEVFKGLGQAPTGDEDAALEQLAEFTAFNAELWKNNGRAMGEQPIIHMGIGESLETIDFNRANSNFIAAEQQWLRYFANSLPGVTAEELTNNWTQTSYVGIRAGLAAASYSVDAELAVFSDSMLTPMADLIVEEAIDKGLVKLPEGAPSYEAARAAWCNIEWVGPSPMVVDPQKEANAARIRMETGLDTTEDWLADIGRDPEDHFAQLGREEKMRKANGLPPGLKQQADLSLVEDDPEADEPKKRKGQKDGDGDGVNNEDDGDSLRGGEF